VLETTVSYIEKRWQVYVASTGEKRIQVREFSGKRPLGKKQAKADM
jgi:hypothetical protein